MPTSEAALEEARISLKQRMTLRTIVTGAPASTTVVSGLLRALAPPPGGGANDDRGRSGHPPAGPEAELRSGPGTGAEGGLGAAEFTGGAVAGTLTEGVGWSGALRANAFKFPIPFPDAGGLVSAAYDWKGNATSATRWFALDGESVPDWTTDDGGAYPFAGDDAASVDALVTAAAADLEPESFTASSTLDALDRTVTATAPDGQLTENGYDAGGRLTSVSVTTRDTATTEVIAAITYSARGQRESIVYGNGATTTYTYEADTFRLSRLYTEGDPDSDSNADAVQDLNYLYDPVGNIVSITNDAEDTLYHDNFAVEASQAFAYDALYRLTEASGRERTDRDAPGYLDPSAGTLPCAETKRTYTETYDYDEVGNIAEVVHVAGGSTTWTRTYTYEVGSNRLVSTELVSALSGTVTEDYVHDARGNMVYLPTLRFSSGGATPNIEASFRDQMVHALLPTSSQEAFYAYDAGGQRVRKRVVTGTTSERRYVGGWEVYREYSGAVVEEERSTLHVADAQSRVLLVETKTRTAHVDVTGFDPVLRYQLGDHLGTVAIELDADGGLISYEEFHPYGTSAWWAGDAVLVSQKRYKFTGMERDEETGLRCHGVRYYAVWLGRWTSADPIGLGDGGNRYGYCGGRVVAGEDTSGLGVALLLLAACITDDDVATGASDASEWTTERYFPWAPVVTDALQGGQHTDYAETDSIVEKSRWTSVAYMADPLHLVGGGINPEAATTALVSDATLGGLSVPMIRVLEGAAERILLGPANAAGARSLATASDRAAALLFLDDAGVSFGGYSVRLAADEGLRGGDKLATYSISGLWKANASGTRLQAIVEFEDVFQKSSSGGWEVLVKVAPETLQSDATLVNALTHEGHELDALFQLLKNGPVPLHNVESLIGGKGVVGTLHTEAVDVGNEAMIEYLHSPITAFKGGE